MEWNSCRIRFRCCRDRLGLLWCYQLGGARNGLDNLRQIAYRKGTWDTIYCSSPNEFTLWHNLSMAARKEVFISATTADLGSYRQVVKEALLTLAAHPVEERNFPTDYRELRDLLARRLDPCDAVIHLVGFFYGGEPDQNPDIPRRSWTQWEYYRATEGEHPKPVYRFLAREDCAFDARPDEDAEKERLQREHRERLRIPGGPIYYEFSTAQELRERILSIDQFRTSGSMRTIHNLPLRLTRYSQVAKPNWRRSTAACSSVE